MKRLLSLIIIASILLCISNSEIFVYAETNTVCQTSYGGDGQNEMDSSSLPWANAYYQFLQSGSFWDGIIESFGSIIDPSVTGVGAAIDPSDYSKMALKVQVALYDLNNDDVPELFIYADDALSEYGVWDKILVLEPSWNYVYTFINNEIKYIDTCTVSAFMNSKKYPGILNDRGRMGVTYYFLDDSYNFQSAVIQGMKDRKVVEKNKTIYDAIVSDGTTAVERVLFSNASWSELIKPWSSKIPTEPIDDGNTSSSDIETTPFVFSYLQSGETADKGLGLPRLKYSVNSNHVTSDTEAKTLLDYPLNTNKYMVYYPSSGPIEIGFKADNAIVYHFTAFITNDRLVLDGNAQTLNVIKMLYDDDFSVASAGVMQSDLELGNYLVIQAHAFDSDSKTENKTTSTVVMELKKSEYDVAGLGKIDFDVGEYFFIDHQYHALDYTHGSSTYSKRSSFDYWQGNNFECWGFANHVQDLLVKQNKYKQITINYNIDRVQRDDMRPLYANYSSESDAIVAYANALNEWKARNGNGEREKNVKSAIIAAGVGAHIRTKGHIVGTSNNGHSYIVTEITSDGIGILQANGSWGDKSYKRNLITSGFWRWDQYFDGQATSQDFYFDRGISFATSLAKDETSYRITAITNLVRYDGKTIDEAIAWLEKYTQKSNWKDYKESALIELELAN